MTNIGYLTSTKRGRETFYELSEPLMRLTFEVKEQSLLEMLIEFLRIWYRPDQIQQLRNGSLCPSTLAYVDAAYERSQTTPDPRSKLIEEELKEAKAEGRTNNLATLWEEKAAASNDPIDWLMAAAYFSSINEDHATAIDCCNNAIAFGLDPAYPLIFKGGLLLKLGRFEEAQECFNQKTELDPESIFAWNHKGHLLSTLFRYKEALRCHDTALELDPKQSYALFDRSDALFALRRWDEGFDAIRNAFANSKSISGYLGDVSSMFSLIFLLSEDADRLQSRISTLVDLYQQAAEERGFRYLISKKESEFVELIKPERRILRQALGLESEEPKQ